MQRISIPSGLFITAALLFLAGCGLVDAPPAVTKPVVTRPASGSADYLNRFYEFYPNGSVAGTEVFYRIYASEDVLRNDRAAIQRANTEDTQNGYQAIMTLGYQELSTRPAKSYLTSNSNEKIRIRLFDEGFDANTGIWKAGVYRGSDNADKEKNAESVPQRFVNNKGFSFFYTGTGGKANNPQPASGDADYSPTGNTGAAWYVNAYAASVGQDINTYTIYYSVLADLGYIKISR